jgi:membrane protease YdiL (CAAX protease family)
MFRIVPLILVMHFIKNRWVTLAAVVASAIVFGFIHGGVANIAIQGVGGLIYGIMFIKFSEQGRNYVAAGAVVVLMHIIFNALQVLTLASYGETVW